MESNQLKALRLFAGGYFGILVDLLLGHRPIGAVEIEKYPRKVLLQRQLDGILPRFPIWDDVTTFRYDNPDCGGYIERLRGIKDELIICAGFPCKGVSPARSNSRDNGKLVGINGASSELWEEVARIAEEIGYPMLFLENSSHLARRGLSTIIRKLDSLGYVGKWGVLGAGHFRADHERERMWIAATHANSPQFKGRRISSGIYEKHEDISRSDWWKNQPGLERVANGLDSQMDRLKAIGNGQCPIVAAEMWEILTS